MSKTVKERWEHMRSRLPENNQQGFTLIELLVVVSILGILAAVVTLSLVGVQNLAQQRAKASELSTVQAAFDTDVQQHEASNGQTGADLTAACTALGSTGTSDLSKFPQPEPLYPNYIHQAQSGTSNSQWTYYCADAASGTLGSK